MRLILTLVTLVFLSACAAKDNLPHSGVKSMAWLVGTWMAEADTEQFVEEWREEGDLLEGQGRIIRGSDTIDMERLTIHKHNDGLMYVVNLPQRQVQFSLRSQTYSESYKHFLYDETYIATFVNDTNDFPREIRYSRPVDDSLYITLTGDQAGTSTSMTFKMKRVK